MRCRLAGGSSLPVARALLPRPNHRCPMNVFDPPPFATRVSVVCDGLARVRVEGELDIVTAPRLEEALRLELDADTDVLLDLSAVPFIDSSGLKAIVTAARMAGSRGRKMTLHPVMARQPRRLFDLAQIDNVVPMSG